MIGTNRWFDKGLNFWICPNGKAGANGEHSPCDAVIPNLMAEFTLKTEAKQTYSVVDCGASEISHLSFKVNPQIMEALAESRVSAMNSCQSIDLLETRFNEFGSNKLKNQLGVISDGFFQAAMQLAFYRLHKRMTATYETASTRQFLHGRTETIRSCTQEGRVLCENIDNKKIDLRKKQEIFRNYLSSHKEYLINASNGKGVDRHLLGLRSMVKEGEQMPAIFDEVYWKSMWFDLSTSNVSPGEAFDGLGFGPATSSGYGINYSIAPENIRFSVCSRKGKERLYDSFRMRDEIIKAMKDLYKLAALKSKI